MKQRQQTVFYRLHNAADEIVGTARSAFKESGDAHPELVPLYLPILVAGTDMRICIESGPPIAASNAIHHAMGKSGQAPGITFMDAVRRAADLLSVEARQLCAANTSPDGEWIDDTMREHHAQMLEVVNALHRGKYWARIPKKAIQDGLVRLTRGFRRRNRPQIPGRRVPVEVVRVR